MPEKTIKIAFRGLMILNYQTDSTTGKKFMEIGFLDARTASAQGNAHMHHNAASSPAHVPRLLTMENGVLAGLLDFRTREELGTVRRWELKAVNPAQPDVTLKGDAVNRRDQPTDVNREHFRWIIDLEGSDMHATNLASQISTARLLMVLVVKNGEFSTKLISPFLKRKEKGVQGDTDFGFSAAVTGLEIKCNVAGDEEGIVDLMAGSTLVKRLQPKPGRDTVFEISNTPPDVTADGPNPVGGHFHMYYNKLFIQCPPNRQFDFITIGSAPGPDPALCGATFLGERDEGL